MQITPFPSPNYFLRGGYKPSMVVIHCTDGNYPNDLYYLCNPNPGGAVGAVSAHYVVAPDGTINKLVDEQYGAWHAGRISNPTAPLLRNTIGMLVNPNRYTIGIETSLRLPNNPTDAQLASLRWLVKDICTRNDIPIDRQHIVGHHEIFSVKSCPGTISVDSLVQSLGGDQAVEIANLQSRISQVAAAIAALLKSRGIGR